MVALKMSARVAFVVIFVSSCFCSIDADQKHIDCRLVFCPSQKLANCKKNEVILPRGKNNCCDICYDIGGPIVPRKEYCDPTFCPRVDCMSMVPDNCTSGQVLVPSDGLCFCCDVCVNKSELQEYDKSVKSYYKRINCAINCAAVSCLPAKRDKCDTKTHVFVPADLDCYCCDACVERRKCH